MKRDNSFCFHTVFFCRCCTERWRCAFSEASRRNDRKRKKVPSASVREFCFRFESICSPFSITTFAFASATWLPFSQRQKGVLDGRNTAVSPNCLLHPSSSLQELDQSNYLLCGCSVVAALSTKCLVCNDKTPWWAVCVHRSQNSPVFLYASACLSVS